MREGEKHELFSADLMAEVLEILFNNLDCEGTRKLASVNKLFRTRSYSAVAVAEFRESQVRLLGLFQSFQVAALRDGRARPERRGSKRPAVADGRRAFLAKIEDNNSLAELADDVRALSTTDAAAVQAKREAGTGMLGRRAADRPETLDFGMTKIHGGSQGVRLPLNLSMNLLSSLTDRERRLLKLGEAFQKEVRCTFRVGKQHGNGTCSVKCAQCSKYACTECHEAKRCSSCQSTFCGNCWDKGSPDMCGICHKDVCSDCRKHELLAVAAKPGHSTDCALCPVFVRGHTCASCAKLPHCAACNCHCSAPPRACDSCGELCCPDCIEESPYCQLCGEFSLW